MAESNDNLTKEQRLALYPEKNAQENRGQLPKTDSANGEFPWRVTKFPPGPVGPKKPDA